MTNITPASDKLERKKNTVNLSDLHHALLIFCFRRSNTFMLKTIIALQETCIKFCQGRKFENLKLIHFVLTSGVQTFTQLWRLKLILHNNMLIHLHNYPQQILSLNHQIRIPGSGKSGANVQSHQINKYNPNMVYFTRYNSLQSHCSDSTTVHAMIRFN